VSLSDRAQNCERRFILERKDGAENAEKRKKDHNIQEQMFSDEIQDTSGTNVRAG
jgi:hypothetical protein